MGLLAFKELGLDRFQDALAKDRMLGITVIASTRICSEFQTSIAELHASIAELMATNSELVASNSELEASNSELEATSSVRACRRRGAISGSKLVVAHRLTFEDMLYKL
jgi:hypothetical protein